MERNHECIQGFWDGVSDTADDPHVVMVNPWYDADDLRMAFEDAGLPIDPNISQEEIENTLNQFKDIMENRGPQAIMAGPDTTIILGPDYNYDSAKEMIRAIAQDNHMETITFTDHEGNERTVDLDDISSYAMGRFMGRHEGVHTDHDTNEGEGMGRLDREIDADRQALALTVEDGNYDLALIIHRARELGSKYAIIDTYRTAAEIDVRGMINDHKGVSDSKEYEAGVTTGRGIEKDWESASMKEEFKTALARPDPSHKDQPAPEPQSLPNAGHETGSHASKFAASP